MDIYSWILTLAIISGQLIKLPIMGQSGATVLDAVVIFLSFMGLIKLKFKLIIPPLFLKSAMVFISIAILSLIFTPISLLPMEYLSAFLYTVRFTVYVLLGWLIVLGAFPSLKNHLPQILIFSGVALAIAGLLQLSFLPDLRFLTGAGWDPHYFRTASTFLDPNFAGTYFAITLLLLTSYLVTPKIFYILFTIVYLALLTTFSRGAYLAFLTGFLTISFLNRSVKLAFISIILFLGLLLGFYSYQTDIAEPRGINRTQSAEFRFNTWQQGWTLFTSHPVLGIGFNAYRFALKEYNLGDEEFLKSHGSSTNDSSFLYVAATTGVVGFVSFLLFLFSLARQGYSSYLKKNPWGGFLLGVLTGLLVQSFFANTFFYPPLLVSIILLVSLSTLPSSKVQKR